MPNYTNCMKEVATNKRRLGDIKTVVLTKECSSMVMSKMLENLKDLGSFTLLIQIGESEILWKILI